MKDRRYKNSKIETDTHIIDLPDGSTLMTIAAFKDGKNMGINIYKAKHNHKQLESWLQ